MSKVHHSSIVIFPFCSQDSHSALLINIIPQHIDRAYINKLMSQASWNNPFPHKHMPIPFPPEMHFWPLEGYPAWVRGGHLETMSGIPVMTGYLSQKGTHEVSSGDLVFCDKAFLGPD